MFQSGHKVDMAVHYIDPVHDFAFLHFDPSAVPKQDLVELPLCPNLAKVGLDIRIIGNDSGARLSIVDGAISRLDRNPVKYRSGYHDFNTPYYQANTFSRCGSSGSPAVDLEGNVVGLLGGSDGASSATFLLPLNRVLRVLGCLQEGRPVTRGDVGCWFNLRTYDECRGLGLSYEEEKERRESFPTAKDLPVANRVVPDGPSHGKIAEGDVILKIGDRLVGGLHTFDETFDENVGKTMDVQVRRGKDTLTFSIQVQNLHTVTPDRFVRVCNANFSTLSYLLALKHGKACKGVYVNDNGGSFAQCSFGLIETINHQPITDLDRLINVMQSIPDRAQILVNFRRIDNLQAFKSVVVWIDRHFPPEMSLVVGNRDTGVWNWEKLAPPLPLVPIEPQKGEFTLLAVPPALPELAELSSSIVHLECRSPQLINGVRYGKNRGAGVVIDSDRGLVLTSRIDVNHYLCDITITIANTIIVEGKVVSLHPDHGYAVVRYNPGLVDAKVCAAKLSPKALQQNDEVYFIGFGNYQRFIYDKTTVATLSPINIEMDNGIPRARAANVDVVTIATHLGDEYDSGILTDVNGTVRAFWLPHYEYGRSYDDECQTISFGLPAYNVLPILSQFHQGSLPVVRILSAEFEPCLLADACRMGMTESSSLAILNKAGPYPRALQVVRRIIWPDSLLKGDLVEKDLLEGDLLVSLEGDVVFDMSGLQVTYAKETVKAEVIRGGRYITLDIPTVDSSVLETRRIVCFGGATVQTPHLEVRRQIGKLPSEVYGASRDRGSPMAMTHMGSSVFITEVNHKPTPDLDSFFTAVHHIKHNTGE